MNTEVAVGNEPENKHIDKFNPTNEQLDEILGHEHMFSLMKREFKIKRLNDSEIMKLIKLVYPRPKEKIYVNMIKDRYVGFLQYNPKLFDMETVNGAERHYIREDIKKHMFSKIDEKARKIYFDKFKESYTDEDSINTNLEISNSTTSLMIVEKICEMERDFEFIYDYEKGDVPFSKFYDGKITSTPIFTTISVSDESTDYNYPIKYVYSCGKCHKTAERAAYTMKSNKDVLKCDGSIITLTDDKPKVRTCNAYLKPNSDLTKFKRGYLYEIHMKWETGEPATYSAFSFNKIGLGTFDAIMFRFVDDNNRDYFFIASTRDKPSNKFDIPPKVEGENYIITFQKTIDAYVKKQMGYTMIGMNPIKISFILQKLVSVFGLKLDCNIALAGDKGTGKTLLTRTYLNLLNNRRHLEAMGTNISIPMMQGTKYDILNYKIDKRFSVSKGFLGTKDSIHIDEIGENKELMQNLKAYLLNPTYGYFKAGSKDITNVRTAQITISHNLGKHIQEYTNAVKKAYHKLKDNDTSATDIPVWDEDDNEFSNLFMPLDKYNNIHLKKAISSVRKDYENKELWWIDGIELPLKDRFPLYFYLGREKEINKLLLDASDIGDINNITNEYYYDQLYSKDLFNFYEELKKRKLSMESKLKYDSERLDKIIKKYFGLSEIRLLYQFRDMLVCSMIFNNRVEAVDEDYHIVEYLMSKINKRITFNDMLDYNIDTGKNIDISISKQLEEDELKKKDSDDFGIKIGLHDDF